MSGLYLLLPFGTLSSCVMSFGAYQQLNEKRRMSGNLERRGSQIGFSSAAGMIIAFLLMGVGLTVVLVGIQVLPVDPETVHAPYWVLASAGFVFSAAGLAMSFQTVRQWAWNRRRASAMKAHSGEPAVVDYAWDERGFTPPHWTKVGKAFAGAAFMTVFLSIFNWWAFLAPGPIPVKIGVAIFDAFLLYIYWNLYLTLGRAIKFGDSRIEYAHFPYRINESIEINWYAPSGTTRATGGTFTLRCVKEWMETTGTGDNSMTSFVQEHQWSGTWPVDAPEDFVAGKGVEFIFQPPPGLPSTNLNAVESGGGQVNVRLPGIRWIKTSSPPETVVFWEFEVKLQLPGLDFEERYLVPVYQPINVAENATV